MSIGDHLEELRRRLALALLGVVPIFAVGLWYGHQILEWLVLPLDAALKKRHVAGGAMQATQLLEGFLTYLKIGMVLAVVFGAPWIVYQLWKFVAPGLYAKERRFFYVLSPLSIFFSIAGVAFMYYIMLPIALQFFVYFNETLLSRPPTPIVETAPDARLPEFPCFAGDPKDAKPGQMWINTERDAVRVAIPDPAATQELEKARKANDAALEARALAVPPIILNLPLHSDSFVVQQYKIAEYVSLVLTFALAFALTFQTPVVVLLLGWTGILPRQRLAKYRKYAILACTLIAAAITPPDFWSMVFLLLSMYALFELGLILLWILPARRVASGKFFSKDGGESPPPV
jgi:sec-independent protein translocase protein TatC